MRRPARRALPGKPAQRRRETLGRTEGHGIPLGNVAAGTNQHDSPLLVPTLDAAIGQLGSVMPDSQLATSTPPMTATARQTFDALGFYGQVARSGTPVPDSGHPTLASRAPRFWMNGYGKLRRMTDRNHAIVIISLYLAAAFVTVGQVLVLAELIYRGRAAASGLAS